MNWDNFKTYGESPEKAFETLCNQLFERYLRRRYDAQLKKYRVINGAGGDGGIEAYGQLGNGDIIAIQSKYFRQTLNDSQISQLKKSIVTAKSLRSDIKVYVICVPHNVSSLRIGRGKIVTTNHEENRINQLVDEIGSLYHDLDLLWWFDNEILNELQIVNNEGIQKYWFEKEVISINYLKSQFELQKRGWLKERYISELHGNGIIHNECSKICFKKDYRLELEANLKKDINALNYCINLIEDFTNSNGQCYLNQRLHVIKRNLSRFDSELKRLCIGIKDGYDSVSSANIREVEVWETKIRLEKLYPTNLQKNILPNLIKSLDEIHGYNLPEYIGDYCGFFNQKIRLILGEAGTGKTHGLSKCVESHIECVSPALIIQAKGNCAKNWTEILSKSLELPTWTKKDIFIALESCAIRRDKEIARSIKSGEELSSESTKILICVDGLEEDVQNQDEWYNRIRECEILVQDYPRLRFLFSARNYFYSTDYLPDSSVFDTIHLPREGDVQIYEVIDSYLKEYDIELPHHSLIKGIDSLLALRLFCEKYQGARSFDGDKILTATSDLLNDKIQRANDEFYKLLLTKKSNSARKPVLVSLSLIAKYFYSNLSIEHNDLCEMLETKIKYLDTSEIDILIEYFSNNGFLVKVERVEDNGRALREIHTIYYITYQSVIEYIISDEILNDIQSGILTKIPDILHNGMVVPLDYAPKKFDFLDIAPNKKIIQDIVNRLFIDSGKLIGENGFLIDGFDDETVLRMQMETLRRAPNELAIRYKPKVDSMFLGGFESQYKVLKYLIIPSSYNNSNVFGAEYLHEILINQPSTFKRDLLWSGLDRYEKYQLSEQERLWCDFYALNNFFAEFGIGSLYLSDEQEFNEKPLVFAWGLSSINQGLRKKLRVELTKWAIENPYEYLKLLDKIFVCNDPQIQEDLASIMLGVATKLKDKKVVKELAVWAIDNIFSQTELYRNVIIRQGFRSIVEKAYLFGEISEKELEDSRPSFKKEYDLLELDLGYLANPSEEYYPIVHDLAWYVIKKAYRNFLEHSSLIGGKLTDHNIDDASLLQSGYNISGLYAQDFTMAAAISYIKSLGFSRTYGNGITDATHGAKSEIFTYEEKYTWLAVHYIQGYLSDYIPMRLDSGRRELVKDYTQLSVIHNPSEDIKDMDEWIEDFETNFSSDWVIKESLASEITDSTAESIKEFVDDETQYDFDKWVRLSSKYFNIKDCDNEWLALYNFTALHDSQSFVYCSMLIEACLIKKDERENFIQSIIDNPDNFDFVSEFSSLISYPKDGSNCSPSDLIWMKWIDEENQTQEYYDSVANKENQFLNAVVDVDSFKMPSRIIRQYLDVNELRQNKLLNPNGELVSFIHKLEDNNSKDSQHMVLVDSQKLKSSIEKDNYEVIWFAEILKQRNPLNKKIRNKYLEQKVRKYFIWNESGKLNNIKIWDARYSNSKE